jgi:hypothetical protein
LLYVGDGVLHELWFPCFAEKLLQMVSGCRDGGRRQTTLVFHVATIGIDLTLVWTRCTIWFMQAAGKTQPTADDQSKPLYDALRTDLVSVSVGPSGPVFSGLLNIRAFHLTGGI